MHAAFLFIHLAAASIWVGGHLVLAVSLLPEAMSKRDPELILGFERIYERIGLPAMVVQIATGVWLAYRLRPDLASVPTLKPDPWTVTMSPGFASLALKLNLAISPARAAPGNAVRAATTATTPRAADPIPGDIDQTDFPYVIFT